MRRIVGIDPGGTTGVAIFDTEHNEWTFTQLGPDYHHKALWDLLVLEYSYGTQMTIVCESFQYRGQDRPKIVLDSLQYIGIAELFHQTYPSCGLVMQTAAMGKVGEDKSKQFVRRKNLKKLGTPWKHETRHSADAQGHILYYVIHNPRFVAEAPVYAKLKMDIIKKGWK